MKRVSEFLNNNQAYITMILDTYGRMRIKSNHDFYAALHKTKDSKELAKAFKKRSKEASEGFFMCHKQGSFYRCTLMYMDEQWRYDHEYFQQMIKQDKRMNPEVIGTIITNMSELIKDNSSSEGGSMPGLQERTRENLSSNDETNSCDDDDDDDDGIYKDGEP